MIRSGYHELWDAHVATIPARAQIAAYAELSRRMAAAMRPFMVSMRQATEAMARFGAAYTAAMQRAADSWREGA